MPKKKDNIAMKTHRFNLELSGELDAKITALITTTGSNSRAECIRRAIAFYVLLITEAKAGNRIIIENQETKALREIVIPEAHL